MVMIARDKARELFGEEDRPYFDKYLPEIVQRLEQMQPQFHRNVMVWKNTADQVIGAHFREIVADQKAAANEGKPAAPAFRVRGNDGPAAPSTRAAGANSQRVEELSPEAKRIANRLDITEDQMRQGIKDLENQGDPDDPSKESSWDRVISFNRRTGQVAKRIAAERAKVSA